jgi:hypothetical protein
MSCSRSWTSAAGALLLVAGCGGGGTETDDGFHPTSNTTISGNITYPSVTIPAGVTVTVSADAVITVTGDYTQNGTLTAPCHALTLLVDGTVTVTGNITNECTDPAADGKALRIVAKTAYSFEGGTTTSSGDISIVNDPARGLTSSPQPAPASVRAPGLPRPTATSYRCRIVNRTTRSTPPTRRKAANGITIGDPGVPGATKNLDCGYASSGTSGGSMLLDGSTVEGGSGGEGGDGTSTSAVEAKGGAGAPPGGLNITADDDIDIRNTVNINGGNAGNGGNATATGAAGNPGVSVTATGGRGGDLKPKNFASPVIISAGGAINQSGTLNITLGHAGNGGNAVANGGAGNPGNPGAPGGNATANGGNGGNTIPLTLHANGAVNSTGTINLAGGAAGDGGTATHNAGVGGAANAPGGAGGPGGSAFGAGGNGGIVVPLLRAELPIANAVPTLNQAGGAAGNAAYTGGTGGDGAALCPVGGGGGKGGDASGGGGNRGTGSPNGALATVTITNFGNGGNGKQGNGPGGAGGINGVTLGSGLSGIAPAVNSFAPGANGPPCPAGISFTSVLPANQTVLQGGEGSLAVTIARSSFTGNVTVQVKDGSGAVRGTATIAGPSGTTANVTFIVPIGEPTGARAWTVTISGTGVADVTQNIGLTVNQASSVDVTAQNNEQATRPWFKFLTKIGSAARVSHTISGSGSVTFPVPTTPTQRDIVVQQQVGHDRKTVVYYTRSDDILAIGGGGFSEDARGSITSQVSGVAANSLGVSYAGTSSAFWPQPNTSPFNVSLTRVQTGFNVVGGCTLFGATQEPQSTILGLATYVNGGTYACNFGGGGVKSYLNNPVTVTGVAGGTSLTVSGGFALDRRLTSIYSKSFLAPTSNYYALAASDLPANVLQWEAVSRTTSTNFEQATYFFSSPLSWTIGMPPPLNNPTVNITSTAPGYYVFQISLATQSQYLEGWLADYTQANGFGGTNEVVLFAFPHYFGSSIPNPVIWSTPNDPLLDVPSMPKLPGLVNGNIFGYGYNAFAVPQLGNTFLIAARLNIAF